MLMVIFGVDIVLQEKISMTVAEIIEMLQMCNQNREIMIFDENSIPYKITNIVVDTYGKQELSHILIRQKEQ
jgi:hypothetical protein